MNETIKEETLDCKKNNSAILLQGPVTVGNHLDKKVISNLAKIRKNFPVSRIVVSCWDINDENKCLLQRIARYYALDIIYNQDPGGLITYVRGAKLTCNLNRMIVSTLNALKTINEMYVIKIRTDSFFSSDRIKNIMSNYFDEQSNLFSRDPEYKVFDERIINGNLFARDAKGYLPYLFHPGDLLLAGLTTDLIKLFSVELANNYIFQTSRRLYFYAMMRYVPEQYIWVNCIANVTQKTPFEGNEYYSKHLVELSEKYYVNNFYLIETDNVDFHWPKHKTHYNNKGRYSLYDSNDWINLYNKYFCENLYPVKRNFRKALVTKIMVVYFIIRTNILRVPYMRMLAVKLFTNRV